MKRNGIPMLTAAMLLVAGAGQEALAQGMKIYFTDGTPVEYDIQKIDRVEFGESLPVETPDYVDLGLPSGTMWATFNIGAGSPEECGGYYAWGETETKDTYSWANYQLCDGSYLAMNKYCTDEYYGTVDGLKALDDTDDAATALLGEGWSIPTREQFEELVNSEYTTRSRTTQAGVEGLKVTSKTNGKSIFLPVGGYRDGTSSYNESNGYYWTKDLYAGIDNQARSFSIEGNSVSTGDSKSRRCGLNIRAVCDKTKVHEYVEIGGVKWATMNVGATTVAGSYETCFGDYFAWGETEPRYSFIDYNDKRNNQWRDGYADGYSLSNPPTYTGATLDAAHDAATANWGSAWRTPTVEEFKALAKACSGSSDTRQTPVYLINTIEEGGIYWLDSLQTIEPEYTGVTGLLFVSKADISKRVFFPESYYFGGTELMYYAPEGFYWSSSLYTADTECAYNLYSYLPPYDKNSGAVYPSDSSYRYLGFTVRPVRK